MGQHNCLKCQILDMFGLVKDIESKHLMRHLKHCRSGLWFRLYFWLKCKCSILDTVHQLIYLQKVWRAETEMISTGYLSCFFHRAWCFFQCIEIFSLWKCLINRVVMEGNSHFMKERKHTAWLLKYMPRCISSHQCTELEFVILMYI